ncbi:hypothetical protein TrCOL_g5614 [Triparma columacea]|uniref:Dynamin N-terminal domain-containing protein n=1 Tax=Triparma columacea TaxID=722753 RepID=A0A9W7L9Z6_9STRA|nr:hypothetical protein TrCOL_g5614 [Triparma columacea]
MPLNTSLRGPLERQSDVSTSLPFVFLVGNHSSGKSTFINHVLGRSIQTAGVAPTDDCFTIVTPGVKDVDQDGPAVIGDPDMGFGALRAFGPTLVHHTRLKVRSDTKTSGFMMVDSPGMIDSPVTPDSLWSTSPPPPSSTAMDRGYDFEGVVRWFATRADVILLFFDPDKPGTTGETLSILVNSLGGMDHKLYIVLNKADKFRKIHDFARAYGSLCWNLSKVIGRKDLPRIYTMCVPTTLGGVGEGEVGSGMLGQGLEDLAETRIELVSEVMKAPMRRVDNAITRLGDNISLLEMHGRVTMEAQRQYNQVRSRGRIEVLGVVCLTVAGVAATVTTGMPPTVAAAIAGAGVLGGGGLGVVNGRKVEDEEMRLVTEEGLGECFRRTYSRRVSEGDEELASCWERVRGGLRDNLKAVGLENLVKVEEGDLENLRRILEEDIPELRRMASTRMGDKEGGGI